MTKTANDLVQETKRHLYSGTRDEMNRLNGAALSGASSLKFTYDMRGIVAGTILSVDLELFYVWDIDATAKTAIVTGSQLGSSPAAHDDGAFVAVAPKFSDFAIFQAINEDINDLSSPENGLYQVKAVERTWNAQLSGYDYASDALGDPIEIRFKTFGVNNFQPLIRDLDTAWGLNTVDFPSGNAVFLFEGGNQGLPVRIRYRAPFGQLTALTDDVQTVTGLPATANDIPPLGAAATLVAPREVKRNFTEAQGDSRRAEEVPAGAVMNSTRGLLLRRQQRIAAEAARLAENYAIYAGEA